MLRRMLIVLMLVSLTSSTNAMTVIFKDYKAATSDEKAFYYLYLDGVREGIVELNVVLEEKRQQPLFCLPERLELTIEQAEDIMMRQAQKMTDPDQLPIGLLLVQGLQNTFSLPALAKHALCALGVVSSLPHQHKETRRGSSPGEFPLSSEGFNMMSTSVSQRRSRKHRPTRATGPSIYPSLISHKSCRKGTLHI